MAFNTIRPLICPPFFERLKNRMLSEIIIIPAMNIMEVFFNKWKTGVFQVWFLKQSRVILERYMRRWQPALDKTLFASTVTKSYVHPTWPPWTNSHTRVLIQSLLDVDFHRKACLKSPIRFVILFDLDSIETLRHEKKRARISAEFPERFSARWRKSPTLEKTSSLYATGEEQQYPIFVWISNQSFYYVIFRCHFTPYNLFDP